jgi:hypothetical protein
MIGSTSVRICATPRPQHSGLSQHHAPAWHGPAGWPDASGVHPHDTDRRRPEASSSSRSVGGPGPAPGDALARVSGPDRSRPAGHLRVPPSDSIDSTWDVTMLAGGAGPLSKLGFTCFGADGACLRDRNVQFRDELVLRHLRRGVAIHLEARPRADAMAARREPFTHEARPGVAQSFRASSKPAYQRRQAGA